MKKKKIRYSYEEKYRIMSEYVKETGKKIQNSTVYKGYNIGSWQNNMRTLYYEGKLNISKELEEAFLEISVLRKEKEKFRSTDEQKYYELIELINKPDLTVKDTDRIYQLSYYLRLNKLAGTLKLSGEQIGVLTKNGLLSIPKIEVDKVIDSTGSSYGRSKKVIEFLRNNNLEQEIDIEQFIKYLDILVQKKELKPVIINADDVSEKTKREIYKKMFDKKDFPDIYLDYERLTKNFDMFNDSTKKMLELRIGKELFKYQDIAKEMGSSHQNVCEILNTAIGNLTKTSKLDIKQDIYAKLLVEKKDKILEQIYKNINTKKSAEEQLALIMNYVERTISLKDLCIPNSTLRIFRNNGIRTINDLNSVLDGTDTKLSEENKDLILKLASECNLGNRIKYIKTNFSKDLGNLIKITKNRSIKLRDIKPMLYTRAYNALKKANITCIGDIIDLGKKELFNIYGLGDKGYKKIISILEDMGVQIGTKNSGIKSTETVYESLENGYDSIIKTKTESKHKLLKRVSLYKKEMNNLLDGRSVIRNIPDNYLNAINRYFTEQDLEDRKNLEKETLINGILRKQETIRRQEEQIKDLKDQELQEVK